VEELLAMLPITKILCPSDFSEPSLAALDTAAELARHFKAALVVLHVVSPVPQIPSGQVVGPFDVDAYESELWESSRNTLNDLTQKRLEGIKAKLRIASGDASTRIVEIAAEEKAGLIVIATHGQTGWRRLVFGSVAAKVVRLAACPVLTVRAKVNME
jgi:nucleotide-binding universal stress UspA family protein